MIYHVKVEGFWITEEHAESRKVKEFLEAADEKLKGRDRRMEVYDWVEMAVRERETVVTKFWGEKIEWADREAAERMRKEEIEAPFRPREELNEVLWVEGDEKVDPILGGKTDEGQFKLVPKLDTELLRDEDQGTEEEVWSAQLRLKQQEPRREVEQEQERVYGTPTLVQGRHEQKDSLAGELGRLNDGDFDVDSDGGGTRTPTSDG